MPRKTPSKKALKGQKTIPYVFNNPPLPVDLTVDTPAKRKSVARSAGAIKKVKVTTQPSTTGPTPVVTLVSTEPLISESDFATQPEEDNEVVDVLVDAPHEQALTICDHMVDDYISKARHAIRGISFWKDCLISFGGDLTALHSEIENMMLLLTNVNQP